MDLCNKMNNINEIKASHLCYGCGTCNVVCAHEAITMQYDNIGRLLPMIDETKCSNCGVCYSHCPSLDLKGIQLPHTEDKYIGNVEKVYIGKATDEKIYKNSQSGGLVTATLKYLFDSEKIDAAVVCRVEDATEYTPKAIVITKVEDLFACQKSFYVPIDIVSAMKQTEHYHSVAVVGTGCHIQGIRALQNFSKKYRDKVKYLLGLICDRTLCKTATDVLYGNYYKGEKKKLIWRDKSLSYKNARVLIKTKDNRTVQVPTWKRHKLKEPFTNPRCRICFDKLNTGADIMYGDPWGMNGVDWDNGMSLVITRSLEGAKIVSDMISHHQAELQEAPLEEVLKGQHIAKRKKNVSSALAYYKKKGWLTPSYAAVLQPSKEDSQLSSQIDMFVIDCLKTKEEIVKQNIVYLKRSALETTVHNILRKPFKILKKLFSIAK